MYLMNASKNSVIEEVMLCFWQQWTNIKPYVIKLPVVVIEVREINRAEQGSVTTLLK